MALVLLILLSCIVWWIINAQNASLPTLTAAESNVAEKNRAEAEEQKFLLHSFHDYHYSDKLNFAGVCDSLQNCLVVDFRKWIIMH